MAPNYTSLNYRVVTYKMRRGNDTRAAKQVNLMACVNIEAKWIRACYENLE